MTCTVGKVNGQIMLTRVLKALFNNVSTLKKFELHGPASVFDKVQILGPDKILHQKHH